MVNRFDPLPWNDGPAGGTPASVARGPRRWEKGLDDIDAGLDQLEDRVDAIQAALGSLLGAADVMPTTERLTIAPVEGKLVVDSDLPALLIGKPGGAGWWKVDLTTLTGAGGGGTSTPAPVLVGELQPGGTIGQIVLTVSGVPAGATAVTFRESRSPTGVSGMPLAGTATTTTRTPTSAGGYDYWVTYTLGGVESPASNHFVTTLPYSEPGGGGGGGGGGTGTPASILNIGTGPTQNHFNCGIGYSTGHKDITQAQIVGGYAETPYFTPNAAGDAVVFTVYANGKTTSDKTLHPRSELRELLANGIDKAAWPMGSGTHVMSGISRITYLPPDSEASGTPRPWTTWAQIHDDLGDVLRLQTNGTLTSGLQLRCHTHSPNGADGVPEIKTVIQSSYTVGQDIVWKIEAINGTCKIYINNVVKYTFSISGRPAYFKAGNYAQFSTLSSDGGYKSTSFSKVELRNLVVTHSG